MSDSSIHCVDENQSCLTLEWVLRSHVKHTHKTIILCVCEGKMVRANELFQEDSCS